MNSNQSFVVPAAPQRVGRRRRPARAQAAHYRPSNQPSRKRQHFGTLARYAFQRTRRISELMAKRLGGAIDRDELLSCGGEAVARCLPGYDPQLAPFRGYIDQRVRWAMLHEYRRTHRRRVDLTRGRPGIVSQRYRDVVPGRVAYVPPDGLRVHASVLAFGGDAAAAGRFSPSGNLCEAAVSREPTPEQRLMLARQQQSLRQQVAKLSEQPQQVITRHYFDGVPFAAVAAEMGMTRCAVCRIHRRALRHLGRRLQTSGIELADAHAG